jgi:hypothetical protein
MDRAYASGAAGIPPAPPAVPSIGYPQTANPGLGVPATKPGAYWYHMVTEELSAVVEAAGLTPDPLALNQLSMAMQAAGYRASAAGGTADAITGTFTPAVSTLTDGMALYARAGSANATATPTFTPNGGVIAAKTIVKGNNIALVAGDIAGAGHWLALQYDATLDKFVLLNPATGISTVTAASDPTFANNSSKPASTSWVRGAMLSIATAAGFAASMTTPGYVKFPSWLGGLVIQWGVVSGIASGGNGVVTFPIAFPTQIFSLVASGNATGLTTAPVTQAAAAAINSASQGTLYNYTDRANSISWVAFGK